ncbi:zinc-finger of the FCS-type, C2-C2 [Carex littledalei]|uniref:Zinc-finger of the FCS-type, C2-C2 n=1 Tax=Carex littledalei TaxID=544730 RepID=A0A833QKJ3_9POAL|nr:zinc-finger of the FCS-type, C2-C2 [Carex littledalei]
MEIVMIFFFLSCTMVFFPVVINLSKHWIKFDHCNRGIPFNGPDLETGPTIFDQHSSKAADNLHLFLNGFGCSFCEKWLQANKAIFFYCDMRFCSDECRTETMRTDDAKEVEKEKGKKSSSPTQHANASGTLYIV